MRIFTLGAQGFGSVEVGALVQAFALQRTFAFSDPIPAIIVGSLGRGRALGVLPVELTAGQDEFLEKKTTRVLAATLGSTRAGWPKLLEAVDTAAPEDGSAILVFRTEIGYRGGNSHTGDRVPEVKPTAFLPFPGRILVEGRIAQGAAGAMGSGQQLVAIVPPDVVFRTGYSGRLYASPAAHYYRLRGQAVQAATWQERQVADLF